MNKAKTGKVLTAAAVANLAVAGFATAPAGAATHVTATAANGAAAAVPSAGRTLPGLVLSSAARQTNVMRAQARGFVPKTRAGIKPDTAGNCTDQIPDVCVSVYGHGLYVSKLSEAFASQSGCHVASWYATRLGYGQARTHVVASGHKGCYNSFTAAVFTSRPQPSHPVGTFPESVSLCGGFWNVPGKACIEVVK